MTNRDAAVPQSSTGKFTEDRTEIKTSVLLPNNPLLEKFQSALREHLSHQIERLKEDIFECEIETKQKDAEREALGVKTYNMQQLVCSQQKELEEITTQLNVLIGANEDLEKTLLQRKIVQNELKERYYETEHTCRELQNEIEAMALLIHQMSQWESQIESDMLVNKRIAEKEKKEQLHLAEEKRRQDSIMYKVMVDVWRLESEIDNLCMQINVKSGDLETMEQSIAQSNTNLEALQAEYRCLMHAWNSVVNAIAARDQVLDCLNQEKHKRHEDLKSIVLEINQTKKLIKKELEQNEKNSSIKTRIELISKKSQNEINEGIRNKEIIERSLYELKTIIQQLNIDTEDVSREIYQKQSQLSEVSKRYEKIFAEKAIRESQLFKILENQESNDAISRSLYKQLIKLKDKKRDLGIILEITENKVTLQSKEIQLARYSNDERRRLLEELNQQHHDLIQEDDLLQSKQQKFRLRFKEDETRTEALLTKSEKIAKLRKKENSPKELKISTLEKNIEETQNAIQELQRYWINDHRMMLRLSKERQEQIHNIFILKKEVLCLEDRYIKMGKEIEFYRKAQEKTDRSIEYLLSKANTLAQTLLDTRNKTSSLDNRNDILNDEYQAKLTEAELACLQLESNIAEIEDDKAVLSKQLIEANREALEWEKKFLMHKENRTAVHEENVATNDLRWEVKKMTTIYAQLKKIQAKLAKDLEHCVLRRDAFFTNFLAKEKVGKTVTDKTRINYTRKLNSVRNKIKQQEDAVGELKKKLGEADNKMFYVKNYCAKWEPNRAALKLYVPDLLEDIEEAKTRRQLNFELLIHRQKKYTLFRDLSIGRTPFRMYKNDEQLIAEFTKQKDVNDRIYLALEKLQKAFPNHKHDFSRMINTLKLYVKT